MTELNDALTLELSRIRKQYDEALRRIETQDAAQQGKDNDIREQLEALSQNIDKPILDIPSLIQNYEQDKKEPAPLQWTLNTLEDHFLKFHRQVQEMLVEKDRLTLENTALQNDRISAESQAKADALTDARTIVDLKSNSRALQTQIDSFEHLVADLKLNLTTLDTKNKDLRSRKNRLKRSISKRDSQITDLRNEMATLRADKLNDEDQIETLHDEIARLEAVREDMEEELADREDEVEEGKKRLHNARWRGRRLKKQRDGARAAKAGDAANSDW